MVSWIHCNKCFARPLQPTPKFFITECGHVSCENCCQKIKFSNTCIVCNKTTSVLPLNKNVNHTIQQYFTPFASNIEKSLEIYKFQEDNYQKLIKHLDEKCNYIKKEFAKHYEANKKTNKLLIEENKKLRTMLKCGTPNLSMRTPMRPMVSSTPISNTEFSFANITASTISPRFPFQNTAAKKFMFNQHPKYLNSKLANKSINSSASPAQMVPGSRRIPCTPSVQKGFKTMSSSAQKEFGTMSSIKELTGHLRKNNY